MVAVTKNAGVGGQTQVSADQPIHLGRNELYSLPCRSQTIRIISGCAWITFGPKDIILYSGEHIVLPSRGKRALISTAHCRGITFEVIAA